MLRHIAIVSTALILTACANIEHKSPEVREHIKRDLKIDQIVDTALTSFCWLAIDGVARCKYTPGYSVLTPDSLYLTDYEKGTFVQKDVIKADDVKCISDADGQNFYVFKDKLAVSLIPYTEVHRAPPENNPEYRAKVIKMLLSNGQPYLTGKDATITRETGRKEYGVHNVYAPGGPIPFVVGTEVIQIFSPCPASTK